MGGHARLETGCITRPRQRGSLSPHKHSNPAQTSHVSPRGKGKCNPKLWWCGAGVGCIERAVRNVRARVLVSTHAYSSWHLIGSVELVQRMYRPHMTLCSSVEDSTLSYVDHSTLPAREVVGRDVMCRGSPDHVQCCSVLGLINQRQRRDSTDSLHEGTTARILKGWDTCKLRSGVVRQRGSAECDVTD